MENNAKYVDNLETCNALQVSLRSLTILYHNQVKWLIYIQLCDWLDFLQYSKTHFNSFKPGALFMGHRQTE